MAAIASAGLIADLERAVEASPGRTAHLLVSVANLLAATADRLSQDQLAFFDEILIRLADRVEVQSLAQLSEGLAKVPFGELKILQHLLRHEEAMVAAPILQNAAWLCDDDLVEIAACRGPAHGMAIARRNSVSEDIVDILLDQGDTGVWVQLAKNPGAKFSQEGYLKLARMAERNDELANLLVGRADAPVDALRELLTRLPRSVRARLLNIAAPELREAVTKVIESVEAGICAKEPERIDYSDAQAKIVELNKLGKLNDSTVNRFATWREYRNVIAALSQLATVPIETIEQMLHEGDSYGLAVACRASRLNWNTALAVISNRPDQQRPPENEIRQVAAAFESLNLSAAQQVIRYGSIKELARKFQSGGNAAMAEAS
jgi:uncharacterized protein (DUF2336 family)